MNQHLHPAPERRTTQAAEGLPRWRWTTAEMIRLTEVGAFAPEDRVELIGGEIVPMSPVSRRHEVVAEVLERHFRSRETLAFHVVNERQFNLSDDTYCKPDIFVRPASVMSYDTRGTNVLLVVEVAASSLSFDLGGKSLTYARHGVREYWVVDAGTLKTWVHREPGSEGYGQRREAEPGELLMPLLVPELAVKLAELRFE